MASDVFFTYLILAAPGSSFLQSAGFLIVRAALHVAVGFSSWWRLWLQDVGPGHTHQ